MTFYLLGLSILLVFIPYKPLITKMPLWCLACLATVISGFLEKVLDIQGVIAVLAYSGLLFSSLTLQRVWLRRAVVCLFGAFSLALALHLLPGFYNDAVVTKQTVSVGAIPFSLYANFDKGLAGLFLLGYFFGGQVKVDYYHNLQMPKESLVIAIATFFLALGLAVLLGLIQVELKLPSFWLSFLAINLLFTCVAEEAFFRGFLQKGLSAWLEGKLPLLIAPFFSAAIFGLAHIAGGVEYVFVAGVAGLGYGYIFHRTKRIEWSILCHFTLNVLHLFLFTYPMLA